MFVDLEFDENGTEIQSTSNGKTTQINGYSRSNTNAPDFYQLTFANEVTFS